MAPRVYFFATALLSLVSSLSLACSKSGGGEIRLNGAGATFPYPLYSKWVAEYRRVEPAVMINYQSIGSGGGIRQVTERTVDFGASDSPMSDVELAKAPGKLLHLPVTLGAVVIGYHLPGVASGMRLGPEVLADIFLGKVTRWNDPLLVALNPQLALPEQAIVVVHRTDGSGTTGVFTEYLAKVSPVWQKQVGTGTSVRWPTGLGAKGNEGVAGLLKTTPGAIGYVELAYAKQAKQPHAVLRNRAGNFVEAGLANITAAAADSAGSVPADLRMSIVDAPGATSYPIAAFSFLLVYEAAQHPARGAALARFLRWAVSGGQAHAAALHYAPLPAALAAKVEEKLRSLTVAGKPILEAP